MATNKNQPLLAQDAVSIPSNLHALTKILGKFLRKLYLEKNESLEDGLNKFVLFFHLMCWGNAIPLE